MKAESLSFGIVAIIKREEIRQMTCQSRQLVNKFQMYNPDNIIKRAYKTAHAFSINLCRCKTNPFNE